MNQINSTTNQVAVNGLSLKNKLGKTINVYDSEDKCIGSYSFETADEYNARKDGNYKALGAVAGAVGVISAIAAGITHVMNKKEEEA